MQAEGPPAILAKFRQLRQERRAEARDVALYFAHWLSRGKEGDPKES